MIHQKKKWNEVENTDNDFACVGAEGWRPAIRGLWNCIIVVAELEKLQSIQLSESVDRN